MGSSIVTNVSHKSKMLGTGEIKVRNDMRTIFCKLNIAPLKWSVNLKNRSLIDFPKLHMHLKSRDTSKEFYLIDNFSDELGF